LWNIDKDANPALDKFKGLALKGFDTVSCQFAVHYLFKTDDTLDRFYVMAYTTKVGGHFIVFDGDTVAAQLKKNSGRSRVRLETLSCGISSACTRYHGREQMVDVYVENDRTGSSRVPG
jgi:hypothetical protein